MAERSPFSSESNDDDESEESTANSSSEIKKANEEAESEDRDLANLLRGQESMFDKMMGRTKEEPEVSDIELEAGDGPNTERAGEEGSRYNVEDENVLRDPFSGVKIQPTKPEQGRETSDTENRSAEPDDPAELAAQQAEDQRLAQEAVESEDSDDEEEDEEKDSEKSKDKDKDADAKVEPENSEGSDDEPDGEPVPEDGTEPGEDSESDDNTDHESSNPDTQPDLTSAEADESDVEDLPADPDQEARTPQGKELESQFNESDDGLSESAGQAEGKSVAEQEQKAQQQAETSQTRDTSEDQKVVIESNGDAEAENVLDEESSGDEEPPENGQDTENSTDESNSNSQFNTLAARQEAQEDSQNKRDGMGVLLGLGLLGERHYRRKADKKLGREINKVKKEAEDSEEDNVAKFSGIEQQQQMQAHGLEELRKDQDALKKLEDEQTGVLEANESTIQNIESSNLQRQEEALKLEAEEEEKKKRLFQSVSGETFGDVYEDKSTEGRERRARMKLESPVEQTAEILAAGKTEEQSKDIEQDKALNAELGFEQRIEAANKVNINNTVDKMGQETASISEILAERELFKSKVSRSDADTLPQPSSSSPSTNIEDEDYRSSIEAGIVIGLVLIALTAVFLLFR